MWISLFVGSYFKITFVPALFFKALKEMHFFWDGDQIENPAAQC